jgi:hypothetical protein
MKHDSFNLDPWAAFEKTGKIEFYLQYKKDAGEHVR